MSTLMERFVYPKTDCRPATLTTLTVRMLPINTALLNTLNALGQHPDVHFADPTQEGWQTITLTWPAGDNAPARIFKFEINVGDVRAMAATRAYSFQARLKLVYVDGVIMRGNSEQLSVGADCRALHTRLARKQQRQRAGQT